VKREITDRLDPPEASAWTSRGDCELLLAAHPRGERSPRIATWNVQYFPDTTEGAAASDEDGTDVQWLACAIASLDVDVLAVQEFKSTERALQKQHELIARLDQLTGGDWRIELAPCKPASVQHPGFLYDASRAIGTEFREIPLLNPELVCSNEVSPGFGAYFRIKDGPDFHFIAVHMQAGYTEGALEGRAYSVSKMARVADDAYALVADTDIVFAGDFNTSGCDDCQPPVSSDEEVGKLGASMGSLEAPLRLLSASETCTRQEDDKPHLILDHFLVSPSAAEIPKASVAHVSGICESLGCERLTNGFEDARDHLSDHCPVTLDLAALDDD
jgi:endonuclease/exonuclease/phosphatase family metal-dependent hydrolase